MAFAGFLDVSYKLFADRGESRGCFLSAMAVVWLVLQTAVLAGSEQHLTLSTVNWLFGLTAGLAITASNLALIESMTVLNVSLSSTVYRLNTIGVMILGVLFLGESVSLSTMPGSAWVSLRSCYSINVPLKSVRKRRHKPLCFSGLPFLLQGPEPPTEFSPKPV